MLDEKSNHSDIAVLGAGSWGTALGVLLEANGHRVTLWEFQKEVAERLQDRRENVDFLPGVPIADSIAITSSLDEAVRDKEIVLIMIPSHVVRSVAGQLRGKLAKDVIIVSGSKGIENDSLLRMSEVIVQTIPEIDFEQVVALSGPSHAEEVGKGIPTLVVAGSVNRMAADRIQGIFMSPVFRVYSNTDLVGVELGGALKNVIAIAAGICDGVGFGDNTKAALLNRGIVEITRLGTAMGADRMTFAGLSGMGDLIVTCTSRHSRNRYVGEEIGKGKTLQQVLDEMVMVAEGVKTTQSVHDLAGKYDVDMPISEQVFQVLFREKDPKKAVFDLMTRDPKTEDWG